MLPPHARRPLALAAGLLTVVLAGAGPATAARSTPPSTPSSPTAPSGIPSTTPTPTPPVPTVTTTPVPTAPVPTVTVPTPSTTIEPFAGYDPEKRCSKGVKKGTRVLGAWLVATYGGGGGASWRPCSKAVSEHEDGRAIDWTLSATNPADVARASAFLKAAFATDAAGNRAAQARRMGIMYVIWDDTMYPAWTGFAPKPYVSSGCSGARLARCSATLRHRDHVHISLSRAGAKARTSWYAAR